MLTCAPDARFYDYLIAPECARADYDLKPLPESSICRSDVIGRTRRILHWAANADDELRLPLGQQESGEIGGRVTHSNHAALLDNPAAGNRKKARTDGKRCAGLRPQARLGNSLESIPIATQCVSW